MSNLSDAVTAHSVDINEEIRVYQGITTMLLFAIGVVMLNSILRTHMELSQSKAMAKVAQIDTATGLYNRSRCQELFKNNPEVTGKKQPAILVFDLNDLKKTNDKLGHRVGDELINSFANLLQNAGIVHIVAPFIGRYGGDEFIVYHEDIRGEDEIQVYLKELKFLTDKFNTDESRFQISYAVGYYFVEKEMEEKLSTRQLFDKADAAMYENKVAGKLAKNQEYVDTLGKEMDDEKEENYRTS